MRLLSRIDGSRFSLISKVWSGATVVIIGGGPSVSKDDIDHVYEYSTNGRIRCIAVNDSYLVAPFSDVLYFADPRWFFWHLNGIDKPVLRLSRYEVADRFARFRGQRCSSELSINRVNDETVHFLRLLGYPHHGYSLSFSQEKIGSGKNSGLQALNLAVLSGASNIILLGFDGRPSDDGRTHFHGGHPKSVNRGAWDVILHSFVVAERQLNGVGVRVINCSPLSSHVFTSMSLSEALPICAR